MHVRCGLSGGIVVPSLKLCYSGTEVSVSVTRDVIHVHQGH